MALASRVVRARWWRKVEWALGGLESWSGERERVRAM
jgi:hypothetical protein